MIFNAKVQLVFVLRQDMKKEVKKRVPSLKWCYKCVVFAHGTCYFQKSAYLCTVFFIVLDLRLTKVGVQRYSFFLCPYVSYLSRTYIFFSGPTPFTVTFFQCAGSTEDNCSTPPSVICNPQKPFITACSNPPAPVIK